MTKLYTSILEFVGLRLWGFKPNIMKDLVEINGGWKTILFFAQNMPVFKKIIKDWGPERLHLMSVAISAMNACPYCTYGHALSFQLHYFKNNKKLFPIDENEMMNLNAKSPKILLKELDNIYTIGGFHQEKGDLKRMLKLKEDPSLAKDKDDQRILHLLKVFNLLNYCAVKNDTTLDHAHDEIHKNEKLVSNYFNTRNKAKNLLN